MSLLYFLCIIAELLMLTTAADIPVAYTKVGTFIGAAGTGTFNGTPKPVHRFLGIPYAEAPVGNLRFSKPVPKAKLLFPYNATYMRPACPQNEYLNRDKSLVYDEDCLMLNVFVPVGNGSIRADEKYPVMVWIYGGGFVFGAADYYNASVLSAFHDVIVVTLNYRLSVFGFLNTGDDVSRGNYGLWDQHLAIKWVHDNIAAFGGDPAIVTVAGESAGSASVYYQATYPGNKDLFQRAIGESGSPLASWGFTDYGDTWRHNLNYFATKVDCDISDTSQFVACLRKLPYQAIMKALLVDEFRLELGVRFNPMVDGEFVTMTPRTLFTGNDSRSQPSLDMLRSVDLMTGVNSMDGGALVVVGWEPIVQHFTNKSLTEGCPPTVFREIIVPAITNGLYGKKIADVTEALIVEYTDWTDPDNVFTTRGNLINVSNDFDFFIPAVISVKTHAGLGTASSGNAVKTFMYEFSPRPSYDISPAYITGAIHAAELPFVFGFPDSIARALGYTTINQTADETALSALMMTMWTNFVKSGDVNGPVKLPVTWPEYNDQSQQYLDFTAMTPYSIKSHFVAQRDAFWEFFIPSLVNGTSRHDV